MRGEFEQLCDALDSATHGLLSPANQRNGVIAILEELIIMEDGRYETPTGWLSAILRKAGKPK